MIMMIFINISYLFSARRRAATLSDKKAILKLVIDLFQEIVTECLADVWPRAGGASPLYSNGGCDGTTSARPRPRRMNLCHVMIIQCIKVDRDSANPFNESRHG